MNRVEKIVIIAAGILILYALFGFFALPRLLKPKLVEAISAYTVRPVALGEISTNPFALSATLRNFILTDRNEERLLKLYTATFNDDPNLLAPEKDEAGKKIPRAERDAAIIDAAFRQLVNQYQVSESELRALAQNRAAAIKDHLVIKGGIEELRVFLQDVEIKDTAEEGEIRLKLALDAR